MRITLGGKLSISLAALFAGLWAMLLLAGPGAYHVQVYGGNAIYLLSFPLGWLGGMFAGGHGGSLSQVVVYLLLMIPNSFLLGYSIAGVFHVFRYVCPSRPKA